METERIAYWKALFHSDTDQAVSEFGGESEELISHVAEALGDDFFLQVLQRSASDTAASLLRNLPEAVRLKLLPDDIPNTVQTYEFQGGSVSQVLHKSEGVVVRTDVFAYGTDTITETRTLSTGEKLTITTNLTTLETTVTQS